MRFKILLNLFSALSLVLVFCSSAFSQFEKYSVPAKWETYLVKDKKVSFLMPRLPVLIQQNNQCQGEESRNYAAYNEGIVYVLKITSKANPPDYCAKRKKFDENNFGERVKFLKTQLNDQTDSKNNISKDSVIKLVGTNKIIKLINNYDNKRWFELSIYGSDENKTEVKKFLDSLKVETDPSGIEIGSGASQTFGDDEAKSIVQVKTIATEEKGGEKIEKTVSSPQMLVKISDTSTRGISIILKERANYTDSARQARVRGKVVLRVTFLANGAIGAISVVSGLSEGLNEEAIKAARKIIFIPAQGNGSRFSLTKPVEYTFSIY